LRADESIMLRFPPSSQGRRSCRGDILAPRSESGCDACYEALVHGAQGIMCRPASAEEATQCGELLQSIRDGTPMRPDDCPAVKRLRDEEGAPSDD
jgi:hypothetical protein